MRLNSSPRTAMPSASVSFRISRNAENLAETIHALSQRLVTLEQRLAAMELQASCQTLPEPEELASLDNVERLLQDCRHLLEMEGTQETPEIDGTSEAASPSDSVGHGAYPAAA
jgi:hypothetical protein